MSADSLRLVDGQGVVYELVRRRMRAEEWQAGKHNSNTFTLGV